MNAHTHMNPHTHTRAHAHTHLGIGGAVRAVFAELRALGELGLQARA